MRSVSDDIKKKAFAPVYVLTGSEEYLRKNQRRNLVKALVSPGDSMNYALFSGKETNPDEVVSLAMTLPFMAEKRVIAVVDSEVFKKSSESLSEYINEPSSDTVLIFDEAAIDKRNSAYKAASKAGFVIDVGTFDNDKLAYWVASYFKRFGKQISRQTVDLLIERAGSDMTTLDTEIKKLASYAGDSDSVSSEDVLGLVSRSTQFSMFQMIDAVAYKRPEEAVGMYYDMIANKEPTLVILTNMQRHFMQLLVVKEMTERSGRPDYGAISRASGIPEFAVRKYIGQSRAFTYSALLNVIDMCVKAAREQRQGIMEEHISVEMIIIKAAAKDRSDNKRG
ncbi:MAG: DNA polymerase III subunit delta [Lachnospiraceae bacterium]|nr:DNA polymerase III subunit delta [Lachnospiraceae bacterium]